MVYQNINRSKINVDFTKNIGKVIYVVEGAKKEFTLLNHIFKKIFDYTVIENKRNKNGTIVRYLSNSNQNSQVYIINTETSNINSINDTNGYLDNIFADLLNNFGVDVNNSAVYYIFDRDNKSNDKKITRDLINKLGNARDNGFEMNGLLLMSYPCLESLVISNFKSKSRNLKIKPADIKQYLDDNKIQQNKITGETIKDAFFEMLILSKKIYRKRIKSSLLDSMSKFGLKVFDTQENLFSKKEYYYIFSLFLFSLWDLKVITYNN